LDTLRKLQKKTLETTHDVHEFQKFHLLNNDKTGLVTESQKNLSKSEALVKDTLHSAERLSRQQQNPNYMGTTESEAKKIDKSSQTMKALHEHLLSQTAYLNNNQLNLPEKNMESMRKTMQKRSEELFAPYSNKPKKHYQNKNVVPKVTNSPTLDKQIQDLEKELGVH